MSKYAVNKSTKTKLSASRSDGDVTNAVSSNSIVREFPREEILSVASRMTMATLASVLTWYAHAVSEIPKCGAVAASAGVSLIASLALPSLGLPAMCGTFAGMSSRAIVPSLPIALKLGLLTSALFEVLIQRRKFILGVGGRLGAVAFLAVNALAPLSGWSFKSKPVPATAPILSTAIFAAVGSIATIALRQTDDTVKDPVRASAVVGLLASLLIGFCGFTDLGALAVYAGSFAGMSAPSRLLVKDVDANSKVVDITGSKRLNSFFTSMIPLLVPFAVVGTLTGCILAGSLHLGLWAAPGGWGGKAGFSSVVAILTYTTLLKKFGPR